MARIRSIKPEFPQSETVGKLSREARLLFIQLWTIVDDSGRARASSRMLASLLYPYDDDVPELIDGWLDELEGEGCIRRYTVDGSHFLDLPNWLKHQKIDRPSQSKLPSFDEGSPLPREDSRGLDADLGPRNRIREEDQEKEQQHCPLPGAVSAQDEFKLEGEAPPDEPVPKERYSDEFEALWHEYRSTIGSPNSSKAKAARFFDRLNAADRKACFSGLVEYVLWLQEQRRRRHDYPAKHLETFINERGWEPFLERVA